MPDLRFAVTGAAGRMGRTLARVIHETEGCHLAGGIERPGADEIGADLGTLAGIGEIGVAIEDDPLDLFARIDAVVDFTTPEATLDFAVLTAQARIVHVIGTTGLDDTADAKLKAAARHARIVKSGNMSLGVNLLAGLTRQVAAALDTSFDIEILEMHHHHKVDAPSGTALLLGEAAADGRGVALGDVKDSGRDGITGARREGDIGFAALRGGSVIGEHSVIFAGPAERITLSHAASSRDVFAQGAVTAAKWAFDQKPGLYSMADVLGLA